MGRTPGALLAALVAGSSPGWLPWVPWLPWLVPHAPRFPRLPRRRPATTAALRALARAPRGAWGRCNRRGNELCAVGVGERLGEVVRWCRDAKIADFFAALNISLDIIMGGYVLL